MEYILQTQNLCKNYGKAKILKNLSMSVPKGSIYGFVGMNGAGKTTLIRVVASLHNASSGSYKLFGLDGSDPQLKNKRRKLGAVVENPDIYPDLTAVENLKMHCRILGIGYDMIDETLALVGLGDTGKKKAKNFSLGMRQRLGIAFALIGDPEFLLLDEPINGLDPQGIVEIRELLTKLNQERNITILISSHILEELSKLATHYGFINKGELIKEMSAEELHRMCSTYTSIFVNDTKILAAVLDEMNAEYKVISDTEAQIYSPVKVTPLVLALNNKGCEVEKISEYEESLENYFIKLVGGNINA